jgi:NTE family protein
MTFDRIHGWRMAALCALAAAWVAASSAAMADPMTTPTSGAFTSEGTDPVAAPGLTPRRPRIGLVLAGGGAKGGAHVGVLKVLEEMHVPVDCIAGTSMGALVGGGYASGIPAAGLEKFLVGINWPAVIGGVGRRDIEPIEQKSGGVTYSNQLDMGLRDGRVIMPAGLVNTSGIDDLLRGYVGKARMQSNFDQLPIAYRAVATDMVTGSMVVLSQGDLATAMRASMAIPGAFSPVLMGPYILSDGGMVRNIPVDVARDLCADVVIVVNLVGQPVDPAKLQSATQLVGRAMEVMLGGNEILSLQSLKPGDVRIDVQMGTITTTDFERVPETIPLGEQAAHAMAGELAKYSLPPEQYAAWRAQVTSSQGIEARLADVKMQNLDWVNPAYLESRTTVRAGDLVNTEKISKQARNLSVLEDIDTVGYQLTGDPAAPTLEWLPKEKNWGPNYLQFDLGGYVAVSGDSGFVLYVKQERRWLNDLGLRWRNEAQVGFENLIASSLYQPLDVSQTFFVEPRVFWSRTWEDIYEDDNRIATYRFADLGGQLQLGMNMGARAQLRAGYLYTKRDVVVETGSPDLPAVKATDAGIAAQAIYDTRDTAFNPTRGIAAAVEYLRSEESLGADRNWERFEMGLGLAVPWRGDVVWVTAAGGTDLGSDLPADRDFTLGGPGSFPGYQLGQVRVPEYWTLSGSYLWKIRDIASIRGQALYAGVRLETGQVDNWLDDSGLKSVYGASLYVTGRTLVGPMTVGVGGTSSNTWSVWLAFGRPVGYGTILERGIFR